MGPGNPRSSDRYSPAISLSGVNMMRRRPNFAQDTSLPAGGTVTAIVASPRAPGRFTVMVDGKPAHTLGLAAIESLGLCLGATTVGREEILAREEAALRTYDRAVMMLAARGRAAKDLERSLVRKGEPVESVRLAVQRLSLEGFVDDEAYARSFVRSKSLGSGFSKRRLQQELARRGVGRMVADEAIAAVFTEDELDEAATVTALAIKRARSLGGMPQQLRKRRLYSFLARRGYSSSLISAAIRIAIGLHPPDGEGAGDITSENDAH